MKRYAMIAAAALALGCATGAAAKGLVLEANGARADGEWGGEFGAGFDFGAAGFHVTPAIGVLVHGKDPDGDTTALYGRVEGTYAFPALAEVGVGARFSGDRTRAYGTVAMPLAPMIALKGNAGKGYAALGLRARF